jgi:hypothetical protein
MTVLEDTASSIPDQPPSPVRVRLGLGLTLLGFFTFVAGTKPEWFGWDRSPVIGFVQITVFLIGLAVICVGGYMGLVALWGDRQRSIAADFGLRLVSTGYLVAVFSGMADIFGLGSHPLPGIPYFGPWQATGVEIGIVVICIGFFLLIPRNM